MDSRDIGLRAQDIQTGLQDVSLHGPASGVFDTTLLTGMAERLAIHIRGIDIIDNEDRLLALAGHLGIEGLVLPRVLQLLEEAEFASVEYVYDRPVRVIERVPYFGDIYCRLGEIWQAHHPREEEHASVQLLNELATAPLLLDQIKGDYGLDQAQLKLLIDIGKEGAYLAEFARPRERPTVLYSPLYWEEKPEQTFDLISKYGDANVAEAIRAVRSYQGRPIASPGPQSPALDRVIAEAVVTGLLPSPEVSSAAGAKRFAFTPYQGQIVLANTERPILQKARAILACVRYGQHFGTITKIRDPGALIRALQDRRRIGAHSEIAMQYAILVLEGVVRIARDNEFPSRYVLHFIDTDDNVKALQLASDMLTIGEAITDRGLDRSAQNALLNAGTFKEPLTTRSTELTRRSREPRYSSETLRRQIETLLEHVREV